MGFVFLLALVAQLFKGVMLQGPNCRRVLDTISYIDSGREMSCKYLATALTLAWKDSHDLGCGRKRCLVYLFGIILPACSCDKTRSFRYHVAS